MRHRQGRAAFRWWNICSRKRRRSHALASTTPIAHVRQPLLAAVQQITRGVDRKTIWPPVPARLAAWRDNKRRIHKAATQVATQLARQGPSTEPTPVARRIALAIPLADCVILLASIGNAPSAMAPALAIIVMSMVSRCRILNSI